MASFDFSNGEHVFISDDHNHRVFLSPQEALDLLQWLSDRKDALHSFIQGDTKRAHDEKLLEIHLHEEDLGYLDELKAAIPDLHEHRPVVKVLDVRWNTVTERALELLKEYRLEYTVHPLLLEDQDAFAQG
jgi:hypothetical protein